MNVQINMMLTNRKKVLFNKKKKSDFDVQDELEMCIKSNENNQIYS